MLMTGHQNARENGMRIGTLAGAVAAIGFPGDHCGPQHTLGLIVGGFQVIHVKEAQQMRAMFAQPSGETGIVRDRSDGAGKRSKRPAVLPKSGCADRKRNEIRLFFAALRPGPAGERG